MYLKIKFGNREIKNYSQPYIIMDIGTNHNADTDLIRN